MPVVVDENFNGTAGANLTTSGVYSKHTGKAGNITYRSGGGIEFAGGGDAWYFRNDQTALTDFEAEWTFEFSGSHTAANTYIAPSNRVSLDGSAYVAFVAQGYFGTGVMTALFSTAIANYLFNSNQGEQFPAGTHVVKFSSNGLLHRGFVNGREFFRCKDNASGVTSGRSSLVFGGSWNAGYCTRHRILTGFETNQMSVQGDSNTWGSWRNDSDVLEWVGRYSSWPAVLYQMLKDSGFNGDLAHAAVPGRSLAQELADYNTQKSTTAIYPNLSGTGGGVTDFGWGVAQCRRANAAIDNVLVAFGINDLLGGATTATIKANFDSYVAGVQATGQKVLLLTIPHCDTSLGTVPDDFNTKADDINAHIIAGNTGADLAIDMTSCEPYHSFDLEHRSIDGIHLRPASHTLAAQYIYEYEGVRSAFGIGRVGAGIINGSKLNRMSLVG